MVRFHSLVYLCAPLFICLFPVILVRPGAKMVSGSTTLTVPFVFHDASPFTPYTSYDISAPTTWTLSASCVAPGVLVRHSSSCTLSGSTFQQLRRDYSVLPALRGLGAVFPSGCDRQYSVLLGVLAVDLPSLLVWSSRALCLCPHPTEEASPYPRSVLPFIIVFYFPSCLSSHRRWSGCGG